MFVSFLSVNIGLLFIDRERGEREENATATTASKFNVQLAWSLAQLRVREPIALLFALVSFVIRREFIVD